MQSRSCIDIRVLPNQQKYYSYSASVTALIFVSVLFFVVRMLWRTLVMVRFIWLDDMQLDHEEIFRSKLKLQVWKFKLENYACICLCSLNTNNILEPGRISQNTKISFKKNNCSTFGLYILSMPYCSLHYRTEQ